MALSFSASSCLSSAPSTSVNAAQLTITPTFSSFLRSYPVYFYNGNEKLQETRIYYGNYARYDGNEDEIKKIVGGVPSDYYEFASWSPSLDEPIT